MNIETGECGSNSPRWGNRDFMLALGLILVVCFLLKIPTLRTAHMEWDEQVYKTLAQKLSLGDEYSLQGTEVLKSLPDGIYDKPLFHHPPLFPIMMVPFMAWLGIQGGVLVSWISHCALVAAAFLLVRKLSGNDFIITVLASIALAFDPLLMFTSQKIWIDSMLAALTMWSMLAFIKGAELVAKPQAEPLPRLVRLFCKSEFWFAISGAVWGGAMLAKAPALFALPGFLALYLCRVYSAGGFDFKTAVRQAICFSLPALVIVLPWFAWFYGQYGMLFPNWTRPNQELLDSFPLMARVHGRPWFYYFKESFYLWPVPFLGLFLLRTYRFREASHEMGLWLFSLILLVAFTCLGINGHTFQMRFLTMLVGPLYILWWLAVRRAPKVFLVLSVLLMQVGALTSFYYMINPSAAVIRSFWELVFG